ncbi:MAG: lamin tail domain-containing protein [Myxococcota bacterium]|nr:lamin tail domain-containing protein [Myxococcota bacterium]
MGTRTFRPALLVSGALAALLVTVAPGCGQEILDWDAGTDPNPDGGTDGGVDAGPSPVISELAGESAASPSDEFVELYNPHPAAISLSGWKLDYRSTGGSVGRYHEFGAAASIPAHGFYLVGQNGFGGTPDERLMRGGSPQTGLTMSASGGSIILIAPGDAVADQVGWGSGAAESAPALAADGDQSIERKAHAASTAESMTAGADVSAGNGRDSNNNLQDFILRPTRDPQSSGAAAEP